jgi:hypothetical protein
VAQVWLVAPEQMECCESGNLRDIHVAAPRETLLYDGFFDFAMGIDSGIAIQTLPKNQCAFAINTSFRGDFVSDRTPFRKLPIGSDLLASIASALKQGPFQAATSFKADSNPESIVMAAGGRLFEIFPSTDPTLSSNGSEITIVGDPNPSSIQQNWIWQAETWAIIQDGLSNPIFYDGVSARRSVPQATLVGTVSVGFVAPPVGGTVVVSLAANYTGPTNEVITVNNIDANGNITSSAYYNVVQVGGASASNQVVLQNLDATPGGSALQGQSLVIQPSNLGVVVSSNNTLGPGTQVTTAVNLSGPLPPYVVPGNTVQINTPTPTNWSVVSVAADRHNAVLHAANPGFIIQPGQTVTLVGNASPNVTVGVLSAGFVIPAIGASVTASLQNVYNGAINQIVFIGPAQFLITATSSSVAPANNVTLENLTDTAGNSILINSTLVTLPELPPGRMGTYGQGRVWQSGLDGISFIAGDLVGGSSGSPTFSGRDAVLKVTENNLLAKGGAFRVPSSGEIITAMAFSAILDVSLGQGPLQVFTNKNIFSCTTPSDRTTWQSLTNPILTVALKGSGASSHYGVVPTNSDIIFRSPDGQIRSELLSRLDFNRWGNTPISFEETRILTAENLSLMNFCSGIEFDNRVFMACNPVQSASGVLWNGLMSLNLDPLSTLGNKGNSIWEGFWNGLNVLQIIRFTNVQRAFALAINSDTSEFELWEFLPTGSFPFDNGTNLITWQFESPPMFREVRGKTLLDLIKLEDGEIYVSDVVGKVFFTIEYKPDYDTCWHPWHQWFICAQQGTDPTQTYPQYRRRMSFGEPPVAESGCNINTDMKPMYGTMFQLRVTVKGHCQVNGCKLAASLVPQPRFEPPICNE